jgi:hypothetical protein
MSDFTSTKKRKHSKYFADPPISNDTDTEQEEDPSDIIIEASSPPRASANKKRTNPFLSSKDDAKGKTKLKQMDTVDLCSTDSDPASPLRSSNTDVLPLARARPRTNVHDYLMDKNGRPRKGLVMGSKTRMR